MTDATYDGSGVLPDGLAGEFARLIDRTNQLFWLVSADLRTLYYVSPSYERIWGRTLESVRSDPSTFLGAIHPEDRAEIARRQRAIQDSQQREVGQAEYRVVHPDGEVRWVRSLSFPLIGEDGRVVRIAGVAQDITDEHRVATALRRSEERFRTIFENAPVMVDSFDSAGRCLLWNRECERTLGWTRQEVMEHPDPLGLCYPDPEEKRRVLDIVAEADGKFREFKVRARSGAYHTQLWANFKMPHGEVISCGLDITSRKIAEEALRDSEAKYRLLFENVGLAVTFFDRDGTFLLLNEMAARNLGQRPDDVVGKRIHDFFSREDADEFVRRMRNVVETGEVCRFEDRIDEGEDTRWYWSILTPMRDVAGDTYGVQVVSYDVTERKLAEEQVTRSKEQLRALASRLQSVREDESAKIAREIHDELGQQLTAVKMDLHWLQRRVARANSRETRAAVVDKIASMADEIDDTIQTVRRISTRLRPGILDDMGLRGALEWEARQFEKRFRVPCEMVVEERRIDLDSRCSTAMFRIFQEILTNVARHARAQRVRVTVAFDHDGVEMTVVDDGRGIPPDEVEHPHGLGILGMQERAMSCGGSVSVRPGEDGGTRVDVKIPAQPPESGDS